MGGGSDVVPAIADPVMLPTEFDSDTLQLPDNAVVDDTTVLVDEINQVDTLKIYNLDVRGNQPSIGTLTSNQFFGMNMGQGIVLQGELQNDGITYDGFELVELYLGLGQDKITVDSTSNAVTYVDLSEDDDEILVKNITGPLVVHGGTGQDTCTLASEANTLDQLSALFVFDGGELDGTEYDTLTLDNSAGTEEYDVLELTRFSIETLGMDFVQQASTDDGPGNPSDSYLINFQDATGGTFNLTVHDPVLGTTTPLEIDFPITAATLQTKIQRMIIPEEDELDSCGSLGTSKCTNAVKVWDVGTGFAIFFIGERINEGVTLEFDPSNLVGFESENFLNATHDILKR